jgi:flagellar biosynthesis GTPase FlhF
VDMTFVDLPGANMDESSALEEIRKTCSNFPRTQVHLVLNGAYETSLLLAQVRAFSRLPITDIIVAHLDEELRWAKLINLVWRTDYPLAWLAAGQNVPGGFLDARPRHLLPRPGAIKTHASALSRTA